MQFQKSATFGALQLASWHKKIRFWRKARENALIEAFSQVFAHFSSRKAASRAG
jgi:hypothetical protein